MFYVLEANLVRMYHYLVLKLYNSWCREIEDDAFKSIHLFSVNSKGENRYFPAVVLVRFFLYII